MQKLGPTSESRIAEISWPFGLVFCNSWHRARHLCEMFRFCIFSCGLWNIVLSSFLPSLLKILSIVTNRKGKNIWKNILCLFCWHSILLRFLSFRLRFFRCLFCLIEDTSLQRVNQISDGIDFSIPWLSRCVLSLFVVCVICCFRGNGVSRSTLSYYRVCLLLFSNRFDLFCCW